MRRTAETRRMLAVARFHLFALALGMLISHVVLALSGGPRLLLPEDYDVNVPPPFPHPNGSVVVNVSIYLGAILEVDEPNQMIRLETTLRFYWNDSRIDVALPDDDRLGYVLRNRDTIKDIWFPDIYVDDMTDLRKPVFGLPPSYLRVYPGGTMVHSSMSNFDMTCPMEFARYPVDVQECHVIFEAYSTPSSVLDLRWNHKEVNEDIRTNQYDFEVDFSKEHVRYKTGKVLHSRRDLQ